MSKLVSRWQSAKVLKAVFDQLSDALVLYDTDFKITGVNQAAEMLFGLPAEDMVGKGCQELFRCGQCEPGCGMQIGLARAAAGQMQGTVRLHTDNGRERLALMRTKQLFSDDGKLEGAVATIKDITDEVEPQKREVIAESPGHARN